jgi:hypothetical protein
MHASSRNRLADDAGLRVSINAVTGLISSASRDQPLARFVPEAEVRSTSHARLILPQSKVSLTSTARPVPASREGDYATNCLAEDSRSHRAIASSRGIGMPKKVPCPKVQPLAISNFASRSF